MDAVGLRAMIFETKKEDDGSSAAPARSRTGRCRVFRGNRHRDRRARLLYLTQVRLR